MYLKEQRVLIRTGNSKCLTINPKWLKLNKLQNFSYGVEVIVEDDKITIFPIKSKWVAKQLDASKSPVSLG